MDLITTLGSKAMNARVPAHTSNLWRFTAEQLSQTGKPRHVSTKGTKWQVACERCGQAGGVRFFLTLFLPITQSHLALSTRLPGREFYTPYPSYCISINFSGNSFVFYLHSEILQATSEIQIFRLNRVFSYFPEL